MTAEEDELIAAALGASEQDYPAAVGELADRGGPRLEIAAVVLTEDPVPIVRMLGVDLLVELSLNDATFWSRGAVLALVAVIEQETEPAVLTRALSATSTYFDGRFLAPVLGRAGHPAPEVRQAVAMALPFVARSEDTGLGLAVDALLALTRDPESMVRDFSTMAIGSMVDADSLEIRAGLLARLDDDHRDTRTEALAGLARRHDRRAIPLVARALASEGAGETDVRSAATLAHPSLLEPLLALRDLDAAWAGALEIAIHRCDPIRQAADVERARAVLDVAARLMPGVNVRLTCERFDGDDVDVQIGPEPQMLYGLYGFLRGMDDDVEVAVATIAAALEDPEDDVDVDVD